MACLIIQNLGELGAGEDVVRPEPAISVAAHQPVLKNIIHRLVIPRAGVQGRERRRKGRTPSGLNCSFLSRTVWRRAHGFEF